MTSNEGMKEYIYCEKCKLGYDTTYLDCPYCRVYNQKTRVSCAQREAVIRESMFRDKDDE